MDILDHVGIGFIISQIWKVLQIHIKDFQTFGGIIVGILFAIEILDEAIDIAMGRGFQLDKKLIIYLFVALFIVGYAPIGNAIWKSAVTIGNDIISSLGEIQITAAQAKKDSIDMAALSTPSGLKWLTAILALPKLILFGFATMLITLSIIILLIQIGGAYACLGFIIISGPLFIAFMLSPHTRSLFMAWIQNLLSYFILIPFLGWTMDISYNIFQTCFKQYTGTGLGGTPEISSMLILIIGPVLAIGITLQVPKIVSTLIGGAGSAGMAGLSAVAGGTMMGNKMLGGSGGSSSVGSPGAPGNSGLVGGVIGNTGPKGDKGEKGDSKK